MIVDDSPTERMIFAKALLELGHELVEAEDGEEAEKLFFESHPDLVILDVVMPKKNGYQVCRSIRTRGEYDSVPIIMVSARNQESDRYWGLRQGADEYLGKPFDVKILIKKVTEHLT